MFGCDVVCGHPVWDGFKEKQMEHHKFKGCPNLDHFATNSCNALEPVQFQQQAAHYKDPLGHAIFASAGG